ncbi:MAG: DEAD/DEAH box helicase, partial [Gammaproteobacteria bacterium]|nr:DEAD/DEAH box helicase [Gammaproteobacteria bacterium]
LFHLYEPWYVDVETGASGMVETGLPVALFEELCRLPMILPEHVEELQAELARCYPKVELPVLRRLEVVEPPFVRPVPCLRFRTRLVDIQGDRDTVLSASVDEVQLTFDYAGLCLGSQQPAEFVRAGKLIRIARDRDLEEECIQQLLEAGLETGDFPQPEDDMESYCLRGGAGEWLDFQLKTLPWLREQGWRIEFDGGFRYRLAEAGQWYGELEPSTGDDWFSVSLGVDVEGERINLLPILMELFQDLQDDFRPDQQLAPDSPRQFIVPLGDGRLVPLPAARVRHIAATMFELYRPGALDGDNRLRLNRFQIARLLELTETPAQSSIKWLGGNEIRGLAARLQRYNEIPTVAPPSGLTTRLREYQLRGLAWLQFLQEQELGGILADDMGLGKTVQALANLLLDKEQGRADRPSLVVAPTSLMVNWRREAQQFTSKLRVLTLHGPRRHEHFDHISGHDLVLTTYALLARDQEALLAHRYHQLILDEAQIIKNPRTKASRLVRRLSARHRFCLTGTPLENHLGELWSLFDFIVPGLLGDEKQFRHLCRNPIERHDDTEAGERLARRIRPFMLRRTKQEVAAELPPKSEIVRSVELEGGQRDLYESIRLAMHARVRLEVAKKGMLRSRIVILDALLKLRQVCCDPRLVKMEGAREVRRSAKLEMLLELLPEMIEEGRRILLFSQFTSMLALIEEALRDAAIPYVKLTGRTRDRATPVDRFQNREVPLFLISLKAGGLGLNLTAADTVIHYDPWWNPAVERQATDRAHRIGQDNPVFVYKFIIEGTVEEKIMAMQARKQALADSLFDRKGGAGLKWSERDLEVLFEPLEE